MGGSQISKEQEVFAFNVLRFDVECGTIAMEKSMSVPVAGGEEENSSTHAPMTDIELHSWAEDIYNHALKESAMPISECSHPSVIAYKYSLLTEDEKKTFQQDVLAAAKLKDKKTHKACKPKPEDYSKSFGGTEMDSKNEHEAADLLRGEQAKHVMEDEAFRILQPPQLPRPAQLAALRKCAHWMKFLSHSGCYLYLHPLTRDLVAVRPEDFVDEDEKTSQSCNIEEEKDPANGLPKVAVSDLPAEVERIVKELKKTPLILDTSAEQIARTFYSYKGHLEDVSGLCVPYGKSGIKKEDYMERCRKRLVGSMKTGTVFVLYLGGVTIEHADFKNKMCKKDVFPKDVFIGAGLKLLEPDYDPKFKLIYRDEDMEAGQKVVRDGFFSVIVSSLDPYEYEAKLADTVPLGYMYPIFLTPDAE